MSDKLMDTVPGGEEPNYESIKTVTVPTSKDAGTFGGGEGTEVADSVKDLNKSDDRGEKTADNIRYGQNISESGMGGMTEGNSGSASTGVGYGGAEAEASDETSAAETRREAGYGGDQDMDTTVGG